MYKRLDDKYIKPCLLRENHFKDPKIIETYENLTERDALEYMKRNPTHFTENFNSINGSNGGSGSNGNLATSANAGRTSNNLVDQLHLGDENLDVPHNHALKDVDYHHQNQRDMDDSNIHHMLSENLFMPRNKVSTHIVDVIYLFVNKSTQCGYLKIILPLRVYVKSIFASLDAEKKCCFGILGGFLKVVF